MTPASDLCAALLLRAQIFDEMANVTNNYVAFLAHDWGVDELRRSNHERVSKVNEALKKAGLTTWFDADRCVELRPIAISILRLTPCLHVRSQHAWEHQRADGARH